MWDNGEVGGGGGISGATEHHNKDFTAIETCTGAQRSRSVFQTFPLQINGPKIKQIQ